MPESKKSHVCVMLGGSSAEREVSLRSGKAAADALSSVGYTVSLLDPVTPTWTLPAGAQVVFLALHGTYGEDGTVQDQLDALGVPYTGCDAESSRLAFDKVRTKLKCVEAGVPTPRFKVLKSSSEVWPQDWQLPVVLKPVRQGSSVGLQFVERIDQWAAALADSFRFDSEVVMETQIRGRETTVGILEDRALPIVEVRPRKGSYDYANKYTPGNTEYFCPAAFSEAITERIQQAAIGAFRAVSGRDYARVDVMVDDANAPWVLEVNTLPGMTETSLLPKAAAAVGISFAELCSRMVEMALSRSANSQRTLN